MLKALPPDLMQNLADGITRMLQTGAIHPSMKVGVVSHLLKDPGTTGKATRQLTSYRPITLQSNLVKLASSVFVKRVKQRSNEANISDCQRGWRGHKGTHESARLLMDMITFHANLKKEELIVVFADGRKAFDSVNIESVERVLTLMHLPIRDRALIRALLTDLKFRINTKHGLTEEVALPLGAPQGSCEATIIYAWLIEPILRYLTKMAQTEGTGLTANTGSGPSALSVAAGILAFADDLALVSTTVAGMQKQLDALHEFYRWARLKMNVDEDKIGKTACLCFNTDIHAVTLRWGDPSEADRSSQTRIPIIGHGKHYAYLGNRMGQQGLNAQAAHLISKAHATHALISTARTMQWEDARIIKGHSV